MMLMPNQRIKITYVIGQLTIGGTEQQLLSLVKSLDKEKFTPSVVCISENAPLMNEFKEIGCEVNILERWSKGRIRTLLKLIKLFKLTRPDIIHAFSYASRAGIVAGKAAGISRIIISLRTDPLRWMTAIDRVLIQGISAIIDNSKNSLSRFSSKVRGSAPIAHVVPNGIDLEEFDSNLISSADRLDEIHVRHYENIVVAVATLRPVKNLSNLLKAFALVIQKLPSATLWIVGDGEQREKLEQLSADLGISEKVLFLGMQANVPSILKEVTIGVLSSKHEGLSNAIIEYMAAGLPVVATDVGGNSELVVNGETGYLVPYNDVEAMANAILRLLDDEGLAQKFGQAGRKRVEENFTLDRMVRETEQIYEDLFSGSYS